MKTSLFQKRILNDRPHLRRKPTNKCREYNIYIYIYTLHHIRRLRQSLRLSGNSSNIDLASRTKDRICVHRTPECNLYQQFDDSPPTQRKQQIQHQERSTAGRYHIAQTVYGSTRKHIPTTAMGSQRLEDRRRIP